ncbi:hypothetical protein KQ51_01523 [Candidatus Izimaplasma bacterium HR1]|jgi:hypothetical protein|uniref:DUF1858 domain-containing protein n=1 Tax=Candidatus Izimoplasma sp. HR1 TaxID=1541959 RepID=UPI0004F82681|nr:hypothetical protein KQ51_01523 [Candidatus Izimaplasma bacterium HR1]
MIEIDADATIYQIVKDYPVIKEIMVELGFKDILKPGLLQSVGRIMSINKGCSMKNIPIIEAQNVFKANGFYLRIQD